MNQKFKHNWVLWYHHDKDNWKLSGYKQLYTIKTIADFWKLYNNFDKINITSKHLCLMKEGVTPLWEDDNNVNGGCWSFRINDDSALELWETLSVYLVSEELHINNQNDIVGLSICMKKNNNMDLKIWNRDSKNNSLKNINGDILKKWGTDIIYIAHMVNS